MSADEFRTSLTLTSPDQTARLARAIAPRLSAGDVLLLNGPIGAGKSHFARHIIRSRQAAIGLSEDIPSPTFLLVQTYNAGDCDIWHCDFYRLNDPQELDELGLEEACETAICLIEWPDVALDYLPADAAHVTLFMTEDEETRQFDIRAPRRWAGIFALADA